MKKANLKGKVFGRLISLIDSGEKTKWGNMIWFCVCSCGNLIKVSQGNLSRGHTLSCGCLRLERVKEACSRVNSTNYKHGGKGTRLYRIWRGMKTRCYVPSAESYKYYGGKGIEVCSEWKNDFANFKEWAMQSGYEENLSIDRIKSNGNYKPDNCQFITIPENTAKANPVQYRWKDHQYKLFRRSI